MAARIERGHHRPVAPVHAKGTGFDDAGQTWLNSAALMNTHSPETPGRRAPDQAMAGEIAPLRSQVAPGGYIQALREQYFRKCIATFN